MKEISKEKEAFLRWKCENAAKAAGIVNEIIKIKDAYDLSTAQMIGLFETLSEKFPFIY